MEKSKSFGRVALKPEHIQKIAGAFRERIPRDDRDRLVPLLTVTLPGERWVHATEAEFYSDITKDGATYSYRLIAPHSYDFILALESDCLRATVSAPQRADVEAVFSVIEGLVAEASRSDCQTAERRVEKSKRYARVFLRPEHIQAVAEAFRARAPVDSLGYLPPTLTVSLADERWDHATEEEFYSDIIKEGATYRYRLGSRGGRDLVLAQEREHLHADVSAPTRADVEAVFLVIERVAALTRRTDDAPTDPPAKQEDVLPTVFIGHGSDAQWRDLKDHLHEKHHYEVSAYEIGARAGHAIRDVLEELMGVSTMAFLVMTGDDETSDGGLRARQNVIHEIGLCQGRLGFTRAIVLLEEGVEEFSNMHGIQQIRFGKGAIRETFGDVVATIRREFP